MAQPVPHYSVRRQSSGRLPSGKTQNWHVGEMVSVGFMRNLMVTKIEATPGDYMPDAYHLVARNGNKYRFVPHNGLERL